MARRDVVYLLTNKETGKTVSFRKMHEALAWFDLTTKATLKRKDYVSGEEKLLHVKN